MKSYIAVYRSNHPTRLMLGAVRWSASSRFSHRDDAQTRLDTAIDIHANLDSPLEVVGAVREVEGKPEIVRHCGNIAQAVGAICPTCKQQIN